MISNFSYLSDPSFVTMRRRFLQEFDKLWLDCMNGDSRETGKLTPEGRPDPSVFSTEFNREGIRVGTAIALMARAGAQVKEPRVLFRHFWGTTKRQDLFASLTASDFDAQYRASNPSAQNRFSFRPSRVSSDYLDWPAIDLFAEFPPTLGILENRRDALVSIDSEPLEARMRRYYDRRVDWETLVNEGNPLTQNMARFDAKAARTKALRAEEAREKSDRGPAQPPLNRRFTVRPFDTRWCHYTPTRPIWNEPRPGYVHQCWPGNAAFVSRRKGVASPEGVPFSFASVVGAQHGLNTDAYYVPLRLRPARAKKHSENQGTFAGDDGERRANLSEWARAYLNGLGVISPDSDAETAGLIWMHALAIGYSLAYLTENADGIRQDWPRIPLPDSKELLLASATLGRKIAALLDTETPSDVGAPLVGAPVGRAQGPPLQKIGLPTRVDRKPLDESRDLAVTAGWGHAGKDGVTMPGKGRLIERDYTSEERDIMLGDRTCDVS